MLARHLLAMCRMSKLAIISSLFLLQACSGAERDLPFEITDDKSDTLGVVAVDPGYQVRVLQCPADTGCKGTFVFDLQQVGADPAQAIIHVGRTPDTLRKLATQTVAGETELVIELDEPEATSWTEPEEGWGHDPGQVILVYIELGDDNPLSYNMSFCRQDLRFDLGYQDFTEHSQRFTIHDAEDEDVFTLEIVDSPNVDTSGDGSPAIKIKRFSQNESNFSDKAETSATYTCATSNEEFPLEVVKEDAANYQLAITPDCQGTDDSGTVTIRVKDPEATVRSCPSYYLFTDLNLGRL